MKITENDINRFLEAKTTPEETMKILEAIASNPSLEEYVVSGRRAKYFREQMEDYGSFIPVGSMAAADGDDNMCDFKCESKILELAGIEVSNDYLESVSKRNYWLRSMGTPLFNMGRLLEGNGFLVNRIYDATIDSLRKDLEDHYVIAVVNGDVLEGNTPDIFADDFNFEDNPNHAVLVLGFGSETVCLYNPASDTDLKEYPLALFAEAWSESRNYEVTARLKRFPEEYNPQPIDVSGVSLNPELEELIEFIAENAHDVWAVDKFADGYSYAAVDDRAHNHYLIPYSMLDDKGKEPDRKMALNTIKLLKRIGYRLVNINSMYKCPDCGETIEPSHNFCPNCGRRLSWEDFK